MSERFRGDLSPHEYKAQGESTEFSEQQERVIREFKEALIAYQKAEETLKNYGVRFTPDQGFEKISFEEMLREERAEGGKPVTTKEIREEEKRIKSELPEGYVLKIEPHDPFDEREGGSIIQISNDRGKTYRNCGRNSDAEDTLLMLKKLNGDSIVEFFEIAERNQQKPRVKNFYDRFRR